MLRLARTSADNADFRALVVLLDQDLRLRDGEDHSFYAQYNTLGAIRHAVVAYADDEPVGCGAFKKYSPGTAEIKRMFVLPAWRGRGVAAAVLSELEQWARAEGYATTILETGQKQPEAIRLYEKSHYTRIPNYGQYAGVENSVCMQKSLGEL